MPAGQRGEGGGQQHAQVGDDAQGEGDADQREQEAEHAAPHRHGGDVAVTCNQTSSINSPFSSGTDWATCE